MGCVVTGYSGGSVIIISGLKWDSGFSRYVCKRGSTDTCTDVIRTDTRENSVQEGRFMLYENTGGRVIVLIRCLEPQDNGIYRVGVGNFMNTDVKLQTVDGEEMFNHISLLKLKHIVHQQ